MMNVHTDSQQFCYGGHDHRSFLRDVAMGQVKLVNCEEGRAQWDHGRAGCVRFGVSLAGFPGS